MKETITITTKGQTTLPVEIRRKLGLPEQGGILNIHFDEQSGKVILTKPLSISELSEQVSRHVARGTEALQDVDEFYQSNRLEA